MGLSVSRRDILGFRIRAQQLDRTNGSIADTSILDLGVQDTGTDGGLWALANRGIDSSAHDGDLSIAWTIRGAPHFYRRADLPSVAAAVAPYSDADAGKRIFDASKPLKDAGIGNLDALNVVAAKMRTIVTEPMVKGEVSTQLTGELDEPYLRFCRPCNATHCYEMPFRMAALQAGLELQPGTSPPVLQPIAGFVAETSPAQRHDVVRGYLRMFGPATPKQIAGFLDATLKDVKARVPANVTEVDVNGEKRWLLSDDVARLGEPPSATRLLGPYDLFVQAKDRELLVGDKARAKALWPVLGRPGAILSDGEIVGTWRPRKSGAKLRIAAVLWHDSGSKLHTAIGDEAERLARFRGATLAAVDIN